MPASILVPDASVFSRWFLPAEEELQADKALALCDAIVEERDFKENGTFLASELLARTPPARRQHLDEH